MMSHKMDARVKDGATMEKRSCFGFAVFGLYCVVFFFLVPGRSRKLNGISRVDVAVVA